MKLLCACIALLAATEAVSFTELVKEEWSLFKLQHKKHYSSRLEETMRMSIFMDNKDFIAKHNARYEKGEVTYTLGINQFSDMSHSEFVSMMNGFKGSKRAANVSRKASHFIEPMNVEIADTVDWRDKGAVTPVKDQGQCGSCWAFSATGSLEGQHFRKTGKLVSLSEQNLLDCSTSEGNEGCDGGFTDYAFEYIEENNGIDTESSYPYEAQDGNCRYKPNNSGATDTGFVDIPEGDEDSLKKAVATVGPISVAIDASNPSFQHYNGEIYNEPDCSTTDLDHAVLAVGYGTEGGLDYWLVKNSWGEDWGIEGYIKMARNEDNNCGIATSASYPLV